MVGYLEILNLLAGLAAMLLLLVGGIGLGTGDPSGLPTLAAGIVLLYQALLGGTVAEIRRQQMKESGKNR